MPKDLKKLIEGKLNRLETVPDELFTSLERIQVSLFRELEKMIMELETAKGKLVLTNENLAKIEEISAKIDKIMFEGDYLEAVTKFAKEFPAQAALTKEIVKQTAGQIAEKEIFQAVLRDSQRRAIDLLSKGAINMRLIVPLKEALSNAIVTGGGLSDTIANVRGLMTGTTDKNGVLLGERFKQQVTDSFAVSDRQYTRLISADLDVEFYAYVGGLVKDSRCFCVERNGGYYHRLEVESWGNDETLWDGGGKKGDCKGGGRNPETNSETIFVLAGGFSCLHSILPYAASAVPQTWIQRAIDLGYYKPN